MLVVDDHPEVVALVGTVLEAHGHQVDRAHSVPAARELLASDTDWELLLTDVKLDGATGLELVAEVQRRVPAPAVVLMSGMLDAEASDLVARGAAVFLQKPFALAELTGAVDAALGAR